jgi:hypothetical protein
LQEGAYQIHDFHFVIHVQHFVVCMQCFPSCAERLTATENQPVALQHLAPVGLAHVLPGHLVTIHLGAEHVEIRVWQVQRACRTHAGPKDAESARSGHERSNTQPQAGTAIGPRR